MNNPRRTHSFVMMFQLLSLTMLLMTTTTTTEASAVVAAPRNNKNARILHQNLQRTVSNDRDFLESQASSSMILLASTTSTTATTSTGTATTTKKKQNPVVGLFGYVKDTLTRTVSGCGTLWSNYGRCQEIRAKIKAHKVQQAEQLLGDKYEEDNNKKKQIQKQLDALPPSGISYSEYAFLQKAKEDRGKVLNLLFISFGAPRFLPYMLVFNADMLPAPMQPPRGSAAESIWEQTSRERRAQIVSTLLSIEKEARQAATGLAKVFGSSKHDAQQAKAQAFQQQVAQVLQQDLITTTTTMATTHSPVAVTTPSYQGAEALLQRLRPHLIKTKQQAPSTPAKKKKKKKNSNDEDEFSRDETRLVQVPSYVIKGMVNAVSGTAASWFSALTPNFMLRGRLLGHIQKVQESDAFLSHNQLSLASISTPLLQQACSDRMIGSPASSRAELQQSLQDWLSLVGNWTTAAPPVTTATSPPTAPLLVYNDNLARATLLTYYGLHGVKDARHATLPRCLFAPGDVESSSSSSEESGSKRKQKRGS